MSGHLVSIVTEDRKEGALAWFGDWLPDGGDVLHLNDRGDDTHPMFGSWVVLRREFSKVGEDQQFIHVVVKKQEGS